MFATRLKRPVRMLHFDHGFRFKSLPTLCPVGLARLTAFTFSVKAVITLQDLLPKAQVNLFVLEAVIIRFEQDTLYA